MSDIFYHVLLPPRRLRTVEEAVARPLRYMRIPDRFLARVQPPPQRQPPQHEAMEHPAQPTPHQGSVEPPAPGVPEIPDVPPVPDAAVHPYDVQEGADDGPADQLLQAYEDEGDDRGLDSDDGDQVQDDEEHDSVAEVEDAEHGPVQADESFGHIQEDEEYDDVQEDEELDQVQEDEQHGPVAEIEDEEPDGAQGDEDDLPNDEDEEHAPVPEDEGQKDADYAPEDGDKLAVNRVPEDGDESADDAEARSAKKRPGSPLTSGSHGRRRRGSPQLIPALAETRSRRRSARHTPESSNSRRQSRRLKGVDFTDFTQSENTLSSLESQSVSDPNTSIFRAPKWEFTVDTLTPLCELMRMKVTDDERARTERRNNWQGRRWILCCVLDVQAPVQLKRGGWTATWRVCAPGTDRQPVTCEVKFWDACAEPKTLPEARKGDVVHLDEVEFWPRSTTKAPCIVFRRIKYWIPPPPWLLFRTLPRYTAIGDDYVYRPGRRGADQPGERGVMLPEDRALRPDLTLARSAQHIRAVAEMADWCVDWYGGEKPTRET